MFTTQCLLRSACGWTCKDGIHCLDDGQKWKQVLYFSYIWTHVKIKNKLAKKSDDMNICVIVKVSVPP
jgi:hypothetical protein